MKLRRKLFSDNKKKDKLMGTLSGISGIGLLSSVKKNKLTGLETFYH